MCSARIGQDGKDRGGVASIHDLRISQPSGGSFLLRVALLRVALLRVALLRVALVASPARPTRPGPAGGEIRRPVLVEEPPEPVHLGVVPAPGTSRRVRSRRSTTRLLRRNPEVLGHGPNG